MAKSTQIKKNNSDKLAAEKEKEYISSLELSINLLQKEIENLRNQVKQSQFRTEDKKKAKSNYSAIAQVLNECGSNEELLKVLFEKLHKHYSILELNMFFFTGNLLDPISENETNYSLNNQVKRLEEQGIIDFIAEKGDVNIIHNLDDAFDNVSTFLILVPISIQARVIGFFICRTSKNQSDFSDLELKDLSMIAEYAAFAIDHIRSKEEINKINQKLAGMSTQMLETSKLITIGELASTVSLEFDSPLKIIKSNLDLLEKGVGNSKRRIEIIRDQVEKMLRMNSKLSNLMLDFEEEKPEKINLSELVDELLSLSDTQFMEEDIKIIKNYESKDFFIFTKRSVIEQILLNILQFSRDSFVGESGEIQIGIFQHKQGLVSVNIDDTSIGLDEKEMESIFEPIFVKSDKRKAGIGLYLANEFTKELRGKLNVMSDLGKGTTYKLILPLAK